VTYTIYIRFDDVEGADSYAAVEALRAALEAQPYSWALDAIEAGSGGYNGGGDE